jgi:hypothetical protein
MTQNYNFFKSCLRTAEEKYNEALHTPRARASQLQNEVFEILKQIEISLRDNELTPVEASQLRNAFIRLDFANISQARAALMKSEKMKQK